VTLIYAIMTQLEPPCNGQGTPKEEMSWESLEKKGKEGERESQGEDPETGVDSTKRTTTNQELYKYKSIGV
jgi:hypothetical protein